MLGKNKIDKKLEAYIKEHSSKGYSKHAIKKVLLDHGYDETYVEKLFKKHSELQFVKKYAIIASLLFVMSIFSFNLIPQKNQMQKLTAYVISQEESSSEGCCASTCQQTKKQECYGKFAEKKNCRELDECIVGCCIDKEGYCLTNYLLGNCMDSNATFIKNDCGNLVFCRNITDKSYSSRLYNLKNKKITGFSSIKTISDYYKSTFNIRFYLYDKKNVESVIANIIDNGAIIDTLALYDDGFHNDGAKNDNLYGNNWQSSKLGEFAGIKKLDVDVTVKYNDGTELKTSKTESIVVVNSKCLPIYTEYSKANNHSIIFAADNYNNVSDGFEKFQSDTQNFLSILFSIENFANLNDQFNIFRVEQSLSYYNVPTLASIISNSCPAYSNKKDLVIILDNNEDYCAKESAGIIRVNHQALFYKNISDYGINESLSDLCSFILTPKMLADQITAFISGPNISINSIGNITENSTYVNVSFTIKGTNYPINYSVFGENGSVMSNTTFEDTTQIIGLELTNETNQFAIVADDKNGNRAIAQINLSTTTQ